MTKPIEKEFFEAFDIPVMGCYKNPNDYCTYSNEKYNKCKAQDLECPKGKLTYPPITDRILLELICVLNNNSNIEGGYPIMLLGLNIEALKENILRRCINTKIYDYVYNAVRKIMGVKQRRK